MHADLRQVTAARLRREFHRHVPGTGAGRWNLYVGMSVPTPSIGDFDEAAEIECSLQDPPNQIDGFDDYTRILNIALIRNVLAATMRRPPVPPLHHRVEGRGCGLGAQFFILEKIFRVLIVGAEAMLSRRMRHSDSCH
jgi:hypothetical protein